MAPGQTRRKTMTRLLWSTMLLLGMILAVAACSADESATPETIIKEVEVIKEVPVDREVIKEVEVVKEVAIEKEVIKEVEVVKEVAIEKEVIKEVEGCQGS
jgi:hypothetical protein